jgi:hypothetical protein
MTDRYHIDPKTYSIQHLKQDLQSRDLIPSRKPLKEGIQDIFNILEAAGNNNLEDLINTLKNKKKLEVLAGSIGIELNYLILLRREVNSYLPNPVPLGKFSGFISDDLKSLAKLGIRNSRHLFERIENEGDLQTLSSNTGIAKETLGELLSLSDLVRAYGVGPAFARILYKTGIHSIAELKQFSPQQVVDLYESQTQKKADFTVGDIQFSLDIIKALNNHSEQLLS